MQVHPFGSCRQKALLRMVNPLELVNSFFIVAQQLRRHDKGIIFVQLLLVDDMAFNGKSRSAGSTDVFVRNAVLSPQGIDALIERQQVVSNVHVAVNIDPLGQNLAFINHRSEHIRNTHVVESSEMSLKYSSVSGFASASVFFTCLP